MLQKNIRHLIFRRNLKNVLQKLQKYYSVYPSKEPRFTIALKLYTDNRNPLIYKIFPIRFCKVRNCHVFDIPKNKFPSHKKIMRFIFIIDNNEAINKSYKTVLFGDDFVNQIDFKLYDKKVERLNKFYNNFEKEKIKNNNNEYKNRFMKKKTYVANDDYDDYDSDEDYIHKNRSVSQSLSKTFRNAFRYGNKTINKKVNKESPKTVTSNLYSDNESSEVSFSKKKNRLKRRHSRSILKIKSRSLTNFFGGKGIDKKKVSFGIVQYSY